MTRPIGLLGMFLGGGRKPTRMQGEQGKLHSGSNLSSGSKAGLWRCDEAIMLSTLRTIIQNKLQDILGLLLSLRHAEVPLHMSDHSQTNYCESPLVCSLYFQIHSWQREALMSAVGMIIVQRAISRRDPSYAVNPLNQLDRCPQKPNGCLLFFKKKINTISRLFYLFFCHAQILYSCFYIKQSTVWSMQAIFALLLLLFCLFFSLSLTVPVQ